jgi:hypothetical protein
VRLQGRQERVGVGVRVPVPVGDDRDVDGDAPHERRRAEPVGVDDDGHPDVGVGVGVLALGRRRGGAGLQGRRLPDGAGEHRRHRAELLRPATRARRAGAERRVVGRRAKGTPPRPRGQALAAGAAARAAEEGGQGRAQGLGGEPLRRRGRGAPGQRGGGEAVGRPAPRLPALDAADDRGERDRGGRGPARDAPALPHPQRAAPPRRHPARLRRDLGRRVRRRVARRLCQPGRPGVLRLRPGTGGGGQAASTQNARPPPPPLATGVARVVGSKGNSSYACVVFLICYPGVPMYVRACAAEKANTIHYRISSFVFHFRVLEKARECGIAFFFFCTLLLPRSTSEHDRSSDANHGETW